MQDLHWIEATTDLVRGWMAASTLHVDLRISQPEWGDPVLLHLPPMAVDPALLEILACPECKEEVRLVPLSEERRKELRDRYREKFRGEEPVVEQGLQCARCHRLYPIVSDIPVMLIDEAIEEPA